MSAWVFGVMDLKSRFIINHESALTKFGYDATELFESTRVGKKNPR